MALVRAYEGWKDAEREGSAYELSHNQSLVRVSHMFWVLSRHSISGGELFLSYHVISVTSMLSLLVQLSLFCLFI